MSAATAQLHPGRQRAERAAEIWGAWYRDGCPRTGYYSRSVFAAIEHFGRLGMIPGGGYACSRPPGAVAPMIEEVPILVDIVLTELPEVVQQVMVARYIRSIGQRVLVWVDLPEGGQRPALNEADRARALGLPRRTYYDHLCRALREIEREMLQRALDPRAARMLKT